MYKQSFLISKTLQIDFQNELFVNIQYILPVYVFNNAATNMLM